MSKYQKSYKSISGGKNYRARKQQSSLKFFLRVGRRFKKALLLFALLVLGAGGAFYFFFLSDKFVITEINISGLKAVSETEVRGLVEGTLAQKRFGFLEPRNYFLFSNNALEAKLVAVFPRIGSVTVQKTQYNTVDIAVEERKAIGVWCGTRDCFYFDEEGVIFEQAPKSFGSLMIAIQDERDGEVSVGSAVLEREQVAFAQDAQGLVGRNFPFSVRTFLITKNAGYEILTSEGWRVLLDKEAGVEYQLSNLKYVLDEEIETRRHELEYVDLRLGNRVYFKYKLFDVVDKN